MTTPSTSSPHLVAHSATSLPCPLAESRRGFNWRRALGLFALLIALIAVGSAVFAPRLSPQITNWDDPDFLVENAAIRDFDVPRIFSEVTLGHWYPLTVLTFAVENSLYGAQYRPYHYDSLGLHIANAWLFGAFAAWAVSLPLAWCAFTSFAFLLHPVASETVGWLAARNHLLMTLFFWMLAFAYRRYALRQTPVRYGVVSVVYGLGLMAKEMLLLFPICAWGLDWVEGRKFDRCAWMEKLPWLLPGAVLGALVVHWNAGASSAGAPLHEMSLPLRALWALKGLVFYASQFAWPARLVPFYDAGEVQVEAWRYAVAALLAAGAALGTMRLHGRERRWFIFGLAFFFLTLAPNLKLLPFGEYSIFNDRYLYLPGIGLILSLAIGLRAVARELARAIRARGHAAVARASEAAIFICALAAPAACVVPLRASLMNWMDGQFLAQAILDVYPNTATALNNLGRIRYDSGDFKAAKDLFERALASRPRLAQAHYNLGIIAQKTGQLDEAAARYRSALESNPNYAVAAQNLGAVLAVQGRFKEALAQYGRVRAMTPDSREFLFNVGGVEEALGLCVEARRDFARAIELDFPPAREGLAKLDRAGRPCAPSPAKP